MNKEVYEVEAVVAAVYLPYTTQNFFLVVHEMPVE